MIKLSFVIPCYRSARTIPRVLSQIEEATNKNGDAQSFEVICVVDGSPDDVSDVLVHLAAEKEHIVVVELTKNFGQSCARMAGYRFAQGKFVVSLDDDGQCPVERYPALIDALEKGADFALADYPKKKQSFFKNAGSRINKLMNSVVLDQPSGVTLSNFFAFTQYVNQRLRGYDGAYPYLAGMIYSFTRNVVNVPMVENERLEGKSTYSMAKLVGLWMNGLIGFSTRPVALNFVFSAVYFAVFITSLVFFTVFGDGICVALLCAGLLGSTLHFSLGINGEYAARNYMVTNGKRSFFIRRVTPARPYISECLQHDAKVE